MSECSQLKPKGKTVTVSTVAAAAFYGDGRFDNSCVKKAAQSVMIMPSSMIRLVSNIANDEDTIIFPSHERLYFVNVKVVDKVVDHVYGHSYRNFWNNTSRK